MLLIGVGGGSVPMALRRLLPDLRIDAVDIDPVVLKAVQRWFGLQADALLQSHAADGVDFVASALASGQRYDAVLLDAFDAEGIPPPLFSDGFLRSLRTLLAPDGAFMANTFAGALSAEREKAAGLAALGRVNDLGSGSGAANRLLMAAAVPDRLPAAERLWQAMPSRRDALSRICIDPAWVEVLRVVERGPAQPSPRRGQRTVQPVRLPTSAAVRQVASRPASTDFSPSCASSSRRCDGSIGARPPSMMPRLPKLANPHSA